MFCCIFLVVCFISCNFHKLYLLVVFLEVVFFHTTSYIFNSCMDSCMKCCICSSKPTIQLSIQLLQLPYNFYGCMKHTCCMFLSCMFCCMLSYIQLRSCMFLSCMFCCMRLYVSKYNIFIQLEKIQLKSIQLLFYS